jgi:hypothetical protein
VVRLEMNLNKIAFTSALFALAAPAFAQAPLADEAKALVQRYVALFNKGDVPQLASKYAAPGDIQAKLTAQFAGLRGEEFGHMDLYDLKVCSATAAEALIQVHYDFAYTYGGVMPPADRMAVLHLVSSTGGWRITGADMLGGPSTSC